MSFTFESSDNLTDDKVLRTKVMDIVLGWRGLPGWARRPGLLMIELIWKSKKSKGRILADVRMGRKRNLRVIDVMGRDPEVMEW